MTPSREESELPKEAPPVVKPKLSSVITLSMVLGAILALFLVYFYYESQRISALQSEVAIARGALKEKTKSVEDMRGQIEALSRQIDALKEYSIARSAMRPARKAEPTAPVAGAEATKPESSSAGKGKAAAPETVKSGLANAVNAVNTLNCDLVGKSVKEQAATMKRCVDLSNAGGSEQ